MFNKAFSRESGLEEPGEGPNGSFASSSRDESQGQEDLSIPTWRSMSSCKRTEKQGSCGYSDS